MANAIGYSVQFEMPVDNPLTSVGIFRGKTRTIFFVPINHPHIHNMGYSDLLRAAELSGRLVLLTDLKNTGLKQLKTIRKADSAPEISVVDKPGES